MFFVISGFVMMLSVERGPSWVEFASARIRRIIPLYWIATTVKIVAIFAVPAALLHTQISADYIVRSYLLVPAVAPDGRLEPVLGVGWTLLLEAFFYAIVVIALALRVEVLRFTCWVAAVCIIGALFRADAGAWTIYLTPRMGEFVIGMLIARRRIRLSISAGLILLGSSIVILLSQEPGDTVEFLILRSIPAAAVVIAAISLDPIADGVPPVLGASSYALYLFHPLVAPPVAEAARLIGLCAPALVVAGSVSVSIVTGIVVHRWIEPNLYWPKLRLISRQLPSGLQRRRSSADA